MGSKDPSLLKMTYHKISEAVSKPVLWKRGSETILQIFLTYQSF